ncbi:MAG: glycosyltransferase [Kamptonema sp. SIO4C4]|nr:glycosyltransferase [Kamptonema sp. SIO4C4]
MNVLQINQSDISGGAAIAAYRLHIGLLQNNIHSHLWVGDAKTNNSHVSVIPRRVWLENQLSRINRRFSLNYLNIVSSFELPQYPQYQNADLLHLHNLHTGYFNYLALPQLTQHKPTVWTLHDMWSLTGHCAYSYDCTRWQIGCGQCPYPDEYPAITWDSSGWEWRIKQWVYDKSNLVIVTPSVWLKQQAEQSLLQRFPIYHIPNGLDTQVFQPLDPQQCRQVLGLPETGYVVLFGVVQFRHRRKGGDLLLEALAALPDRIKSATVLLMFGQGGEEIAEQVGIKGMHLGYVGNDRLKAIAYSAADLSILPTRLDNCPLGILESFACGTPVVSFAVGGVPEFVHPDKTGYLASPEDAQELSRGMVEVSIALYLQF